MCTFFIVLNIKLLQLNRLISIFRPMYQDKGDISENAAVYIAAKGIS